MLSMYDLDIFYLLVFAAGERPAELESGYISYIKSGLSILLSKEEAVLSGNFLHFLLL